MRILLDTNIVLRYSVRGDARRSQLTTHVDGLVAGGSELCIAPQSLYESWVVATRTVGANGLGLSTADARLLIHNSCAAFTLLPEPADLVDRWLTLCVRYDVKGRTAHDARIVALMSGNGVNRLLTLNVADFRRYQEIECIDPLR